MAAAKPNSWRPESSATHPRCARLPVRPTATAPRPDQPDANGENAKGLTGPAGPWARRHELPSHPDDVSEDDARTHAPVRSPDQDGASMTTTWTTGEVTNEHARAAVPANGKC
jgi:hypothetical protein